MVEIHPKQWFYTQHVIDLDEVHSCLKPSDIYAMWQRMLVQSCVYREVELNQEQTNRNNKDTGVNEMTMEQWQEKTSGECNMVCNKNQYSVSMVHRIMNEASMLTVDMHRGAI